MDVRLFVGVCVRCLFVLMVLDGIWGIVCLSKTPRVFEIRT